MRYRNCFFAGMFIVGLLTPAASPVFASTIATFDGPAARFTVATGINERGQIVGVYFSGPSEIAHGFLLDRDTFTTIDVPGARKTVATGINDRGQIVGTSEDGFLHSFLLDRGTFTAIDVPGFPSLQVIGINDRGQTVGTWGGHGFVLD